MRRAALALAVSLTACPSSDQAAVPNGATPGPVGAPTGTMAPVATVPVIAVGGEQSLLDGIRLGAEQEDVVLDIRSEGGAGALLRGALDEDPPAILVVASVQATVDAVIGARPEIEATAVPVIVLGSDLYTELALHRYLFQTAVPLRWQARVLARYLVADRGYESVVTQGDPVADAALREEGVEPVPPGGAAEAVLGLGRITSVPLSGGQAALSSEALLVSQGLTPGTVACYPYTWAGWADMLPRVHRFRVRFERMFGHPPRGFEQEGYDAVRALAEALDRTGGEGGEALVDALESFREEAYSSLPVRLGPDDHVLAEESQLGLFAVSGPGEQPAPGEAIGTVPWRPIMRTFTTDGQKVNLLDRDKKVFFPGWHRRKPSPRYWKSGFGIVTRPDEDPLH